jgi:hypothetical protein
MDNKNTGMDLYEALKSGLSADELQNQFMTDLAAAKARYQKEEDEKKEAEKQQREEELNDLRSIVAGDLEDYFEMVFGKENCKNLTAETIAQELKDLESNWEKNLNWITDFNKSWDNLEKIFNETLSKNKSKTKEEKPKKKVVFNDIKFRTDDDIIKEFLDSLK